MALVALSMATGGLVAQPEGMSDADMRAAVQELDAAMSKVLKIAPMKVSKGTSAVAKRSDAVRLVHDLFEHYEPSFRTTPRPFRTVGSVVRSKNQDKDVQDELLQLSRWGLVGPVGPLAAGGQTLTPEEFGDALGYFYAGVALYSYQPDPEWTPDLVPSALPDEE